MFICCQDGVSSNITNASVTIEKNAKLPDGLNTDTTDIKEEKRSSGEGGGTESIVKAPDVKEGDATKAEKLVKSEDPVEPAKAEDPALEPATADVVSPPEIEEEKPSSKVADEDGKSNGPS